MARHAERWCEMVLPMIARAVASKLAKDAAKNTAKQTAKEAAETTAQQAAKETAKFPGQRVTEYTPEISGRMRYRQPREDEFFETRTPRMSDDYKKGGKVKTYAKGGSVKGGGCEQRGLRKCKVV